MFHDELPSDYDEFIDRAVFKLTNYMFYDKKENIAYCTRCKTQHKASRLKLRHNKSVVCPLCTVPVTAKSKGYVKNGFEDVMWSQIIEPEEDKIKIRHIRHIRQYDKDGQYTTYTCEMMRQVITESDYRCLGLYYDGWSFFRKGMGYGISVYREPILSVVYNLDVNKELENTIFKHCDLQGIMEYDEAIDKNTLDLLFCDKHIRIKQYIGSYLFDFIKNKWIEQLWKCGLKRLAFDLISPYTRSEINTAGTTPTDILEISKKEYKLLKSIINPRDKDLKMIRDLRGVNYTEEQLHRLAYSNRYIDAECIRDINKYISVEKSIDYYLTYGTIYKDYLMMCNTMEYDMKSKSVLFPKDVKKAHDDVTKVFNSKKLELMADKLKVIAKDYEYECGDLKIVVPKNGNEIAKEGSKLHHCVARYINDVAAGHTMILFIRKKKAPRTSYYTLEWRDNRVIQCHGLNNINPTEEIQNFVDGFKEEMLRRIA